MPQPTTASLLRRNAKNDKASAPMSKTLAQLIAAGKVSPRVMALMQQPAVEAIALLRDGYSNDDGLLDDASFVFSDDLKHISIVPQVSGTATERSDVMAYGDALLNALISAPSRPKRLTAIAQACIAGDIGELGELHLKLEKRVSNTIYVPLIFIILGLLALLWWLNKCSS